MNKTTKKIGIMGGTFDPPHLGHLISAKKVKDSLNLDKVIFIPTGNIYYKDTSDTLEAKIRYEMVCLAVSDYEGFEVSDIEVKTEGYSYTCDTLKKLKKIYPNAKLYFIVGADSLDYMEKWKNPQQIFDYAKIVAVGRDGFSSEENIEKIRELNSLYNGEIILIDTENIDVSSTEIREKVKAGKIPENLVADSVLDYIIKNNLYKNGDTNDGN